MLERAPCIMVRERDPAVNLAYLIHRIARTDPERPAVAFGTEPWATYGELADRVASVAGALRGELGLQPGDAVAIAIKNHPAYFELLFGIWHAGLVAVPINAKLHAEELAVIVDDSGAKLVVTDPDLPHAAPIPVADRGAEQLAWLFYTSGTTGRPKGAMLSHRNLLAMTLAYFADVDPIAPSDCMIHAAPLSHGSGLYALPHVAAGATNVVPRSRGFDVDETLDLIAAHPGASFFFAPTMVHALVCGPDRDASNLKTIVYGGGPMYLEDLRAGLDRFGPRFVQIYGQGEAPMTITAVSKAWHADTEHPRYWERLATVGVPRTGVEVRVVDERDRELPPGAAGEVVCRGDVVMAGYRERPDATARTLHGGWLHTGDLGSFDDAGLLTLRGRTKDLIITGGSNVYPREVEEVLLRHPAVAEVAVVGAPDRKWGERVVAFVVARAGASLAEGELDALCLDHIARFKRPKAYRFVDTLPKNAYGKVLKTALRDTLSSS